MVWAEIGFFLELLVPMSQYFAGIYWGFGTLEVFFALCVPFEGPATAIIFDYACLQLGSYPILYARHCKFL